MSIVSSYFSSYRPRRSSSSRSSSSGLLDVNSLMDTLSSILAGLALRFVIDRIGGNENKLTGTLVGLWEGVVLQHFMEQAKRRSRRSRSRSGSTSRSSSSRSAAQPYEAYLAYAVRLFVDYLLTESLMRVVLIGLWTGLGVALAEVAPSVWRDTGMKRFWRRFKRDMYYMQRSLPRMPRIDIQLPWEDNRPYSSSVYSSRPIGTRTTTVRFSPSRAASEVSVITSTTQPPPLIQSFSSRIVPRSSLRPVPGAFPGDTVSVAGTEVTGTPASTSLDLRSPGYSDVSTESSGRGGLFGSAFNAFSFLTGPGRRASYPSTDADPDDDNRSTASTVTHSVGTSLHNPAEIPDEDDSDTETEAERAAAAKKSKGKGKARAVVEDVPEEATPTRPDIVLPTPSESGIISHPSHLPLLTTTTNPDYLGVAPVEEQPPPSAEMPVIPNDFADEEWENISKGDAGSSPTSGGEVHMVPPPPGQTTVPEKVPADATFESADHEDGAEEEEALEYLDEPAWIPKRPDITFTYQIAPVPLPSVGPSITSLPPVGSPRPAYRSTPISAPVPVPAAAAHDPNDLLANLPQVQPHAYAYDPEPEVGNTSEFGEMRQPLGQMLGLGRNKKKAGGSVLDFDFGSSPWNADLAPATRSGPAPPAVNPALVPSSWNAPAALPVGPKGVAATSIIGGGKSGALPTFVGSKIQPPPVHTPEFFTAESSVGVPDEVAAPVPIAAMGVPPPVVADDYTWNNDNQSRPPTYHSRRQSMDQALNPPSRRSSVGSLSGLKKAVTEAGIGAPEPTPTPPPAVAASAPVFEAETITPAKKKQRSAQAEPAAPEPPVETQTITDPPAAPSPSVPPLSASAAGVPASGSKRASRQASRDNLKEPATTEAAAPPPAPTTPPLSASATGTVGKKGLLKQVSKETLNEPRTASPAPLPGTPNVPPLSASATGGVGSRKGSRQPSREPSVERVNTAATEKEKVPPPPIPEKVETPPVAEKPTEKPTENKKLTIKERLALKAAQSEVGTRSSGDKVLKKALEEPPPEKISREGSVESTNRKATTELNFGMRAKNESKEKLEAIGQDPLKRHSRPGSVVSVAASEPPVNQTKGLSGWGLGGAAPKKTSSLFGGGWGSATKKLDSFFDLNLGAGNDTNSNPGAMDEFDAFGDAGWGSILESGSGKRESAGPTDDDFKKYETEKPAASASEPVKPTSEPEPEPAPKAEEEETIPDSALDPFPKGGSKQFQESLDLRRKIKDLEQEVEAVGDTPLGRQTKKDLRKYQATAKKWFSAATTSPTSVTETKLNMSIINGPALGPALEDAITKLALRNDSQLTLDGSTLAAKRWKSMKLAILSFATKYDIDIHDEGKTIQYLLPTSKS